MAKSLGKTISSILILSVVSLSVAGAAIGVRAAAVQNMPDTSENSTGEAPGVSKIEKTRILGLIDEYTITYTDETTSIFYVTNGKNGTETIQGLPGRDGHTPTIEVGTNGNWVMDGVDLGIKAEGLRGPQADVAGRGIVKIEKTNTYGLVDEYTITYTDETTSTFLVTNGANGEQGIQGLPGSNGHTPVIEIGANGNWIIDNVDSGVAATGTPGANGKSAYDLAVEKGYTGTVEEWLLSLVGGAGKSAYEVAVDNGYTGTEIEWLDTLVGADGLSAYQLYCENHLDPDLSLEEWLASLNGENGKSAYEIYCDNNIDPDLSMSDWLESLVGSSGRGISSISGPVTSGNADTYTINYTDGSEPTQFIVTNGVDGQNGKSLLTGSSDPDVLDGQDGDSYINTTTWEYFVKEGTSWVSKGSVQGANGTTGADGKSLHAGEGAPDASLGADGDSYVDVSNGDYYLKDHGAWGYFNNIKGADGAAGRSINTVSKTDETASTETYTITYSYGDSTSYTIAKARSIVSVTKTSSEGGVDTYTITYNYGDASTFTVTNGADGKTIYNGTAAPDNALGAQGDVYIDTASLDIYIKGMSEWGDAISFKGTDGKGISTIEKTSTSGLVDTYTITFTDMTSATFTVTNGADGKDGTKVITGNAAPVSTENCQEGDSYINTSNWDYYVLILNGSSEFEWELRGNIKGADGTKLTTGDAAPSSTSGHQEGDSYIDTATWDYYVLILNGSSELEWDLKGNIHSIPNTYTVTFESNGGSDVDPIDDALEGRTITKPDDPTKDDWYFEGWYTSEGNKWSFEKDVVTSNITLLARWGQLEVTDGILTGCTLSGDITIPYAYNGEIIYGISSDVFAHRDDVEKVTLPETITEIPDEAFSSCPYLQSIVLPDSVTKIGDQAFYYCDYLQEIDLPANLLSIGVEAFAYNGALESISFPSSLEKIDDKAFSNCWYLEVALFAEHSDAFYYLGESAFEACSCLRQFYVPETTTWIGEHCFDECSLLSTLSVPFIGYGSEQDKGLAAIFDGYSTPDYLYNVIVTGNYEVKQDAFENCYYITDVSFTGTPTSFAKGCLAGLDSLENLSLPYLGQTKTSTNNRFIAYLFGGNDYYANSSVLPGTLKGVEVRSGTIGRNAFYGCNDLLYLVFGKGVTEFENPSNNCESLYNCNSLEYLEVPFVGTSKTASSAALCLTRLFGGPYSSPSYVPESLEEVVITNANTIPQNAFYCLTQIRRITIDCNVTSIANRAFYYASGLESVSLPNTVNSIGSEAFYNCTSLVSITLPQNNSSFTAIGNSAFARSGIKAIVVPDSVIAIGNNAFKECRSLEYVDLGDNVISIGDYCFENCSSLRNVDLGASIETLGQSSFKNCSSLESIYIPASVTSIGNDAFYQCTSLSDLTFSNYGRSDYLTIGQRAFSYCGSLTYLVLPDMTSSLQYGAFSYCNSLVYIYLPSELSSIFNNCFYGDISLQTFVVSSSETSVGSYILSGCKSLSSISLYSFPSGGIVNLFGSYDDIPASLHTVTITGYDVTDVPSNAFYKVRGLTHVILPSNITSIGVYAFRECTSLVSFNVPSKVTSIGDGAFQGCTSLVNINGLEIFDSSVTSRTIGSSCFRDCSSLVSLKITNVPEFSIGSDAFRDCNSLTQVELSINNSGGDFIVGTSCFKDCNSLSYVKLKCSATSRMSIRYGAFENCKGLSLLEIEAGTQGVQLDSSSFRGCSSLLVVDNKSDDLLIAQQAFMNCVSLRYFRGIDSFGGIESIGYEAFKNCWSLEMIEFGFNLTTIGEGAFMNCTSLRSIEIPSSVDDLGDSIFYNCTALVSVSIPDDHGQLTEIPDSMFAECTSLTEFTLPVTVTSIGNNAFENTQISSISFSSFLTEIGDCAFKGTKITSIEIPATVESIGESAFEGCGRLATVTLDEGVVDLVIGDNAFKSTNITSIVLHDHVTAIGEGAFESCLRLASVTLPDNASYTAIADKTFKGCTLLTSITLTGNIDTIGQSAFAGTGLTSMTFNANVATIGSNAFRGCAQLASINFLRADDGLTVEANAFYQCANLATISTVLTEADYGSWTASEHVASEGNDKIMPSGGASFNYGA